MTKNNETFRKDRFTWKPGDVVIKKPDGTVINGPEKKSENTEKKEK